MRTSAIITATASAILLTGCATSGLTFDALDKDGDGFAKFADVASADKVGSVQTVSAFDTNSDAQLSLAEFEAYVNSSQRASALDALAAQRRAQAQIRDIPRGATSRSSSGSYGS